MYRWLFTGQSEADTLTQALLTVWEFTVFIIVFNRSQKLSSASLKVLEAARG